MSSAKSNTSYRIDPQSLENALKNFKSEFPDVLTQAHSTLFSDVAIGITEMQMKQMRDVIDAVETLVALPAWHSHVFDGLISKNTPLNKGVFFGYDFHLNEDGAHLIEINTNAGGAFLSALFEQSQNTSDLPGKSLAQKNIDQVFVEMFRHEWSLARGEACLQTIAIVDETPHTQYFYPEFILAKQLFERVGIQALIADPADFIAMPDGLYIGDVKIDLIYNRLTDFSLEKFPALNNAYQQNLVVMTPHPYAYTLYADKRNLSLMTDVEFLRTSALDENNIAILQKGIPQTRLVEERDAEQWWKERKDWFFKPATGYGGRGSYRGDKLTQRVFGEIVQGGYVTQRKAMPGEVMVKVGESDPAAFKYDVRCYVYEGQVQLLIARLYQGQTTNFRTPGGGFGLVRVE